MKNKVCLNFSIENGYVIKLFLVLISTSQDEKT